MMSEALSSMMSLPGGYFSTDPPSSFESMLSSYSEFSQNSSPFDFSSFYGHQAASLLGTQPQPSEFPNSSSPVPLGWPSQVLGPPGSLPFQPPQMQPQQIQGLPMPMQPINMNPSIGSTTTVAPGGGRSVFIPRYELSARGPVYVGSWTRHTKEAAPGGATPGGGAAAAAAAAAAVAGPSAAASGSVHGSVPSLVGSPSPSPSPAPKTAKAAPGGKDRSARGGREGGAGSKEGSTAPPTAKPTPRPLISRPISPKADGDGSTHHGHSAAELQAMIHTTSSLLMAQLQLTEQNVRLVSLFAKLQAHWQGELPQELAEELTSGVDSAEAACSYARHTLIATGPAIRAAAPTPASPHQHARTGPSGPSGPSAPSSPPQGPSPAGSPPPLPTDILEAPGASLSPSGVAAAAAAVAGLALSDSAACAAGVEPEGREETVRGASRR